MKCIIVAAFAAVAVFGQKIETQKANQTKITRLATMQNHLSVIEFNEPVKEVALGSSNFKVEWRENKVFVQPLEPNATTNLFIWTTSGRRSYELVPATSVDEMHFAIDEEPVKIAVKQAAAPPRVVEQPKAPAAMLLESAPVRVVGASKRRQKVEVILQDVYRKDGRVYVRYAIVNGGRTVYQPAAPDVFALQSPRASQTLITMANCQLAGRVRVRSKEEAKVEVVHTELQAPIVRPGQTARGLIAFDLPPQTTGLGERAVVKFAFPADSSGNVSAVLVL